VKALSRRSLLEALYAIGLQRGDGVMVHSALHFLGRPEEGQR